MRNLRTRLSVTACVALSAAGLAVVGPPAAGSAATGPAAAAPSAARAVDKVGKVVKRVGKKVTIAPGLDAKARARCRAGETLVGGGAVVDGTDSKTIFLRASAPDPANARRWLAHGYNNDAAPRKITAVAMCAKRARRDKVGVVVRTIAEPTTLAAFVSGSDTATCRAGERLVGGGASGGGTAPSAVFISISAPDPAAPRRWRATGFNNDLTNAHDLRATAFCARAARPDKIGRIVKRAGANVTLAAMTAGSASASCRRGERLVGGGAIGTGATGIQGVLLTRSAPVSGSPRRWRAAGFNFGTADQKLRAFALCAKRV